MHSVWGKIKLLITVKVSFKKPLTPVHTMAFLAPSLEAVFLVLWSVRHCKKDNSELYLQLQFCVCALRLCFDYGPMNKDINVNNFSYGEAEVSLEHSIQALVQPLLFTSFIPWVHKQNLWLCTSNPFPSCSEDARSVQASPHDSTICSPRISLKDA